MIDTYSIKRDIPTMSPREEDATVSTACHDGERGGGEESLEVLPLSAMPLYHDRMKEDGTSHVYLMGKMRTDGTKCEGALRLWDMVDRLEAHNGMTFDERIRALRLRNTTANEWEISKVISSMNGAFHQVLVCDMDETSCDGGNDDGECGGLLNARDYTNFIIEYIEVVRAARDAAARDGTMSAGDRAALMKRTFSAATIPSSIVAGMEDVLETLNSILFDAISEDVDDEYSAGTTVRTSSRDHTPFLMEYINIVTDVRELIAIEGGRSSGAYRDYTLRAYKAGRLIGSPSS